jgi:hypothetical protein
MWGELQTRKTSDEAENLLDLVTDFDVELLLPVGTKTRQERSEPSTIDLVFGTRLFSDCVVSCGLSGNELAAALANFGPLVWRLAQPQPVFPAVSSKIRGRWLNHSPLPRLSAGIREF